MKYINANEILPQEIIKVLQEYIQGEYLYIPIKEKSVEPLRTDYKIELGKRNAHIYTKYLEGVENKRLAEIFHLSESSIRRIIIEQRRIYEAMTDGIKGVLENWVILGNNMLPVNIKQIYDTAWQIGDKYVLKVYDKPDALERNLTVISILEEMNIPVGRIVFTEQKERYVEVDGHYYFLSEKLQGSNLVNLKEHSHIAYQMGEVLADLHLAFKECEKREVFWNKSLLEEMNGWVKRAFAENDWRYVSEDVFHEVVVSLAHNYDKLPVQLIHRDVHFGNFLFDNGRFSGYIDFDLSQRNIRIFDLCYFLLGLLSEQEKLEIGTEQWFDFLAKVFRGYESKVILSDAEKAAVPYVMECIELLFVAWFLKQEDIACAEDALRIFEFVSGQEERIKGSI